MEQTQDTDKLLQECDAGVKMAVSAFDEVLDHVTEPKLKQLLEQSKSHHGQLGNEIHAALQQRGSDGKEPNAMAKGMSWMKTNWKLSMEDTARTVADLITDGCNMGTKSLHRYRNQYGAASDEAKHLCDRLIEIEEKLAKDLTVWL